MPVVLINSFQFLFRNCHKYLNCSTVSSRLFWPPHSNMLLWRYYNVHRIDAHRRVYKFTCKVNSKTSKTTFRAIILYQKLVSVSMFIYRIMGGKPPPTLQLCSFFGCVVSPTRGLPGGHSK